MKKKYIENKLEEFNNLENDVLKWKWIAANQNLGVVIMLDNDSTYGVVDLNNIAYIFDFDEYVGSSYGVGSILTALGIKSEYV